MNQRINSLDQTQIHATRDLALESADLTILVRQGTIRFSSPNTSLMENRTLYALIDVDFEIPETSKVHNNRFAGGLDGFGAPVTFG